MNTLENIEHIDEKVSTRIELVARNLEEVLNEHVNTNYLSPQISRRLLHLLNSFTGPLNVAEIFKQTASLFHRLLLELIQAQYNTKQREQDLIRLIESKGCTIRDPELIDQVIELLVRLYKASIHYKDSSLERKNLIKYIMKELNQKHKQKDVEKVIQTIYRCSCFHVTQQQGNPSRLKLKDNLYNANEFRYQLDVKLMNLARENSIRLSPESWAYLLHGRSTPENISKTQSMLDKHVLPVEADELEAAIRKSDDRVCLGPYMNRLHAVQHMINELRQSISLESNPHEPSQDGSRDKEYNNLRKAIDILEQLLDLKHLFAARQLRSKLIKVPS